MKWKRGGWAWNNNEPTKEFAYCLVNTFTLNNAQSYILLSNVTKPISNWNLCGNEEHELQEGIR